MYYFIFVIAIILLIWFVLVYVRKSMWDAVHRNLLDLEDYFEGKVIRNSILARPVFHGNINGTLITLNFSTEKTKNGRVTYINISYDLTTKFSLTLSSEEWLNEQDAGEQEDYTKVKNNYGQTFLIRPFSKDEVKQIINKEVFIDFINQFSNLTYFFSGKTGILCEFKTEQIAKETEIANLENRFMLIDKLSRAIH